MKKTTTETKTDYLAEFLEGATMLASGKIGKGPRKGVKVYRIERPTGDKHWLLAEKVRPVLHRNADASRAELAAAGFEKVCGAIAGLDSGSDWIHEDGRSADIRVRNLNRITYREATR